MEALVVLWAIAYAVAGAFQEGYRDGRTAVASGAAAVRTKTAALRSHPSRPVRALAKLATVLGTVLVGGGRAVRGTGRSLGRGARSGYVRGQARGRVRVRRIRRERAQPRATPEEASPSDPGAGPPPDEPPAPARPADPPAPPPAPPPPPRPRPSAPPPPSTGTPRGDDGLAASTDPQHPRPTPPQHDGHPVVEGEIVSSTSTQNPTGEATGIAQARRQIGQFVMAAAAYFRKADASKADAASAERMADQLVAAADTLAASMRNGGMDKDTLAEVARMREQAARLRAAAVALKKAADALADASDGLSSASVTTQTNMQRRHGRAEEAIKSTKDPAKTGFYQG